MDANTVIIQIFALALAVSVHESAHAWTAWKFGDPTAKDQGRISLNPLDHIDPMGTLIVPAILIFTHAPFLFGWAKPVPVSLHHLRDPRLADRWVSAAGPISNLALAFLIGLLFRFAIPLQLMQAGLLSMETAIVLRDLIIVCVVTNLGLAIFNLVPIPPLDGFGVAKSFLSYEQSVRLEIFSQQWGFAILVAFIYLDVFRAVHRLFMAPLIQVVLGVG